MLRIIKNFSWTIISSISCIILGILTFTTFINQSFIPLTDKNLQFLLIIDIFVLIIFFSLISLQGYKIYISNKRNKTGSKTNIKYISLFALFTFLPSFIIAIFSLFLFNFGVENLLNDKITKAINNSYNVAKNYLEESKKTIESDILLMSVGVNRASYLYYSNQNQFNNIIRSERILRRVDDVYLIDSSSNVLFSESSNIKNQFQVIPDEIFNKALEGLPVLILNDNQNKNSAVIKINSLIDTYLYISRNIDSDILSYLNETEQAVNFYYSLENSQTGIKITFAIIYTIIVTLLLFLSTVLAIRFATRLTKPIINLISASENISKGELNSKVPLIEDDEEFKILNQNFNNMIDRLKSQQDKLLTAERYSAWESVARKLAHEIKNPLTPIQLSIDMLKDKYSNNMKEKKEDFLNYLSSINRQIKDIENLVNEFSSFARMPRPIFKKVDLREIIKRSIILMNSTDEILINYNIPNKNFLIYGDAEQLNRVFINLVKNSKESFLEKKQKKPDFIGKIDIVFTSINDYISIKITDNGDGIIDIKKVMTPYFTTKKTGTGLGLPIVNKIIIEHDGELNITSEKHKGTVIEITFPEINE